MSAVSKRWPPVDDLRAIADLAERLADCVQQNTLTTAPDSPFRAPWLQEDMAAIQDVLREFREVLFRVNPAAQAQVAKHNDSFIAVVDDFPGWSVNVKLAVGQLRSLFLAFADYFRVKLPQSTSCWTRGDNGLERKPLLAHVHLPERTAKVDDGKCERTDKGIPVEYLGLLRHGATRLREALKKQGPSVGAISSTPPLDDKDVSILRYLEEMYPLAKSQTDIEAGSLVSRRTIGRRLAKLRDKNLTHRPKGEKGGEAITDQGRKLLARCPPSPA